MRQTSNRGKRWNTKDESGQVRCHCGRPAVLRSAEGICKTYRPGAKVYGLLRLSRVRLFRYGPPGDFGADGHAGPSGVETAAV